jgi:hypothetical protein
MALPVHSYVWFRLRHIIGRWAQRVTELPATAILYDSQNQPSPSLPYIGLTRRDFPAGGDDEEYIHEVATSVTLTCTATVVADSISLVLFGTRYSYTLVLGDTPTTARDALLALIAPDLVRVVVSPSTANSFVLGFQPCTAVADGAASIVFAGLGVGPVRLLLVEGGTLASETAYRHVAKGLRRFTARVELFWSEQQSGFETIDAHAGALTDSLGEDETAWWLADRGVGVEQAALISVQDASVQVGGARERRLFFDVLFNAQSKRYRISNAIETVIAPAVEIAA